MSDYSTPIGGPGPFPASDGRLSGDRGPGREPYPRRRDRRPPRHSSQSQRPEDSYTPEYQDSVPSDDYPGYGESFRSQTFSDDYPEPGELAETGTDGHPQNPYGQDSGYAQDYEYPEDVPDQEYESYQGEEYGRALAPQFDQVYHQPYNQPHESYQQPSPEDYEEDYPDVDESEEFDEFEEAGESYADYPIEEEQRAAYQADFRRTRARDQYDEQLEDDGGYGGYGGHEPGVRVGRRSTAQQAYALHGGTDPIVPPAPPIPEPLVPAAPALPLIAPGPAVPMSAAPMPFPISAPTPSIPAPRAAATTGPTTGTSTGPIRLPMDRIQPIQPRRQAQRRPSPAARGFVPSQDRIGTAREVMTYLARRPWLQLDVVDIILGTQFDRDDVAHALIVLQQTGRIRSHLRGDRVCYSYAASREGGRDGG